MSFKEWIQKKLYGKEPIRDIPNIEPFNHEHPIVHVHDKPIVRRYTIPVGGLTREQADAQIKILMRSYNDDVKWDENSGEVNINNLYNMCGPHGPHKKFIIPIGKKKGKKKEE